MHQLAEKLRNYRIILGSASPRRKELLAGLDLDFTIRVKNIDETIPQNLPYDQISLFVAQQKFNAFLPDLSENEFLITADTLVHCDGRVVGKPESAADAREIIQFLSGKTHKVITGVCFGTKRKMVSYAETTSVTFTNITSSDIEYYIEKYRPFDKAGAYGVQEWIGYVGIQKIEGSYFNVMGLPVQSLYTKILQYEE